jgi:hypothetical protein
MSSGGSSGPDSITPVPQTNLQTTGWGGMGYTATPQTYTQEAKPSWMQGAWDMPTWGYSASDPGHQLTQAELQPTSNPAAVTPQTAAPSSASKGGGLPKYAYSDNAMSDPYLLAAQAMGTNQYKNGTLTGYKSGG